MTRSKKRKTFITHSLLRTINDYSENVEKSSLVWKEGDDEDDDDDD